MKSVMDLKQRLQSGALAEKLGWLYCCAAENSSGYADRYLHVLEQLDAQYDVHEAAALFSAPGRTEIGGNHTDHQHGCVLAGSVNIDMIAAVGENDLNQLRLISEGYAPFVIDLNDLDKKDEEENTSYAILRGTCKAFADRGAKLKGLDVFVASNVPKGSGVSSSAAFEVLIGTIFNELFMGENKVSPIEIAQIGQWVENVYFGKPCGLMDQMASAVGGLVTIDFFDKENPVISSVDFDFASAGHALCIIDSRASHADLTDEYAAITQELKAVCAHFGKSVLTEIDEEDFYRELPTLRQECGDRAVMRAMHFYRENARVPRQVALLQEGDFEGFLRQVSRSGESSYMYLQNVIPSGYTAHQDVAVTLGLCAHYLKGRGACRVHGGGFAGTVQAFVPLDLLESFRAGIDAALGEGACHVLSIRPQGGVEMEV